MATIGVVTAGLVASGRHAPEDLLPPGLEVRAGPAGDVYEMATAQPDGRPAIVSGGLDGTIRIWGS